MLVQNIVISETTVYILFIKGCKKKSMLSPLPDCYILMDRIFLSFGSGLC